LRKAVFIRYADAFVHYAWISFLQGLFRKILGGKIRPSKLVRMSADELASKELAHWREQETKHVSMMYCGFIVE